jgi:hypothetical protein
MNHLKVSDIFKNPYGKIDGDVINGLIKEITSKEGFCVLDLSDTTYGVGASFLQAAIKGVNPSNLGVSKTTDKFYYMKICEYMDYELKVFNMIKCKDCKYIKGWGPKHDPIYSCTFRMKERRIFDPVEGVYRWPEEINKAFVVRCITERKNSTGFLGLFIDKKRCGIDGKNFEHKVD